MSIKGFKMIALSGAALLATTSLSSAKDWLEYVEILNDGIDTMAIKVQADVNGYDQITTENHVFSLDLKAKAINGRRIAAAMLTGSVNDNYFESAGGLWRHVLPFKDIGGGLLRTYEDAVDLDMDIADVAWVGNNPIEACDEQLQIEIESGRSKKEILQDTFEVEAHAAFYFHVVAARKNAAKAGVTIGDAHTSNEDFQAYHVVVQCVGYEPETPYVGSLGVDEPVPSGPSFGPLPEGDGGTVVGGLDVDGGPVGDPYPAPSGGFHPIPETPDYGFGIPGLSIPGLGLGVGGTGPTIVVNIGGGSGPTSDPVPGSGPGSDPTPTPGSEPGGETDPGTDAGDGSDGGTDTGRGPVIDIDPGIIEAGREDLGSILPLPIPTPLPIPVGVGPTPLPTPSLPTPILPTPPLPGDGVTDPPEGGVTPVRPVVPGVIPNIGGRVPIIPAVRPGTREIRPVNPGIRPRVSVSDRPATRVRPVDGARVRVRPGQVSRPVDGARVRVRPGQIPRAVNGARVRVRPGQVSRTVNGARVRVRPGQVSRPVNGARVRVRPGQVSRSVNGARVRVRPAQQAQPRVLRNRDIGIHRSPGLRSIGKRPAVASPARSRSLDPRVTTRQRDLLPAVQRSGRVNATQPNRRNPVVRARKPGVVGGHTIRRTPAAPRTLRTTTGTVRNGARVKVRGVTISQRRAAAVRQRTLAPRSLNGARVRIRN
ncbi:MAG: hypothetical protein AAGE61_16105 [Pseudomonadota bacterium]